MSVLSVQTESIEQTTATSIHNSTCDSKVLRKCLQHRGRAALQRRVRLLTNAGFSPRGRNFPETACLPRPLYSELATRDSAPCLLTFFLGTFRSASARFRS